MYRKTMGLFLAAVAILLTGPAAGAEPVATDPPRSPAPQGSAAEHLNRAHQLLAAGQLAEAISVLGSALALAPDSVQIRMLRGTAYGSNGQWQEAGSDLEAALRLEPDNAIALGGMGIVLKQAGRGLEAIDLMRRSLAGQENQSLHRTLIYTSLEVGDRDGALSEMERYSKLYPGDKTLNLLRIDTLLKAGRGAEVEQVVDRVVAATPDPVEAEEAAVLLYGLAGQSRQATSRADEAIAKAPSAQLLFLRAMSEKDPSRQISDLRAALELNPGHFLAHSLLVEIYLTMKDYRAAMRALDQLEGLFTTGVMPPDVYRQRGDALTGLRNKAGASLAYASARAEARNGSQLNSLCWKKATSKAAPKWLLLEALKDCDAALALLPESWECHDSRGLVMLRLKRFKDAVASYDAAVSGIPASAMSLYGRGLAKTHTRRKAEGKEDTAAAIRLSPDVEDKFRSFGVRR